MNRIFKLGLKLIFKANKKSTQLPKDIYRQKENVIKKKLLNLKKDKQNEQITGLKENKNPIDVLRRKILGY